MEQKINPDQISKWWKLIKQIIDLIVAALAGAVTAVSAQSCGLLAMLSW